MPELRWRFGYFFALAMMVVVAIGMLWWFKKRGWLRSNPAFDTPRPPGPTPSGAMPELRGSNPAPVEPRD